MPHLLFLVVSTKVRGVCAVCLAVKVVHRTYGSSAYFSTERLQPQRDYVTATDVNSVLKFAAYQLIYS